MPLHLLAACQTSQPSSTGINAQLHRWQGTLTQEQSQWYLQPCDGQQRLALKFDSSSQAIFDTFIAEQGAPEFIELGAQNSLTGILDTRFIYRLQTESHGCADPDFSKLTLKAQGNEPFWALLLNPQGLLLQQPGVKLLALPYIEEQHPDGFLYISSQAEHQQLQLWISPQPCTDSMSGNYSVLSAVLDWNGQTFKGCAHYGALRHY